MARLCLTPQKTIWVSVGNYFAVLSGVAYLPKVHFGQAILSLLDFAALRAPSF